MKSVALHNLGCKVNAYEMDIMQQILEEKGYVIVPFHEKADIYIINTCTVTNIADRKSRQMLHQARARNPQAVVVAAGCYVQTGGREAAGDAAVDLVVGNNKKREIADILEEFFKNRENASKDEEVANIADINGSCDYEEAKLRRTAGHTRAYIKIQDGCNQFCSYCIIPYARGRVRSRRWEDIRQEMEGLAAAGYREVVFTGIHISSYGLDLDDEAWEKGESVTKKRKDGSRDYTGKSKLLDLLERVQDVEGVERIRLGSLEPRIVTENAAKRLAAMSKVCPHFHLSLQSGCDETLKRMNRHYTTGEYLQCVNYLRGVYENPAITTDVIVGFPGETEEEFARTRAFLKEAALYEMHIFRYSERKGTVAAGLPGRVPETVRAERSGRLFALEKELSAAFRGSYIGKETEVLFEEKKEIGGKRYWIGHTPQYLRVAFCTDENMQNRVRKGRLTGFLEEELLLMK